MPQVLDTIERYWGFSTLRPLQEEAIEAGIQNRDSLVVLPTGGGKSLCYQVPPAVTGRTDLVVSPLISLMKDQVDGLQACGYPAAALHSNLSPRDKEGALRAFESGALRLLFVAPERLFAPGFLERVRKAQVRAVSVDEAHCISHWGHDFRPEYRRLAEIRRLLPDVSLHAYTATATARVRHDIAEQLGLRDPLILTGRFDRANLVYRVLPRTSTLNQVAKALARHPDEGGIVYCLSRKETESTAEGLRRRGIDADAYHAGLNRGDRTRIQEAFAREELDVVVATVAFGMGIDRSNVRCVVHASLPESVEHYQQESGRAGRDGLEAECVLLYSPADVLRREHIIRQSSAEEGVEPEVIQARLSLLREMQRYANAMVCRHAALSRYFGQDYPDEECGACDVCLGEAEGMEESTEIAQKILSCVARMSTGFGVGHVAKVLRGSEEARVLERGHNELSTHGLLADLPEKAITNLIYQLVDQELLERTEGDYPVLRLNDASLEVLRGQKDVILREPRVKVRKRRRPEEDDSWEDVDRDLFERLRSLRRELAGERDVPAYLIFSDATLREMARHKPANPAEFREIKGVGDKKLADFGPVFLEAIGEATPS